jgi:hypothetical protein
MATHTSRMSEGRRPEKPLASYVLRIRGRPPILRFELDDLRTGERRVFVRPDRLVVFLQQRGQGLEGLEPVEPKASGPS